MDVFSLLLTNLVNIILVIFGRYKANAFKACAVGNRHDTMERDCLYSSEPFLVIHVVVVVIVIRPNI